MALKLKRRHWVLIILVSFALALSIKHRAENVSSGANAQGGIKTPAYRLTEIK